MQIDSEELNSLFSKIGKHLPVNSGDDSLLVLKGHLLCEECLNEYLKFLLPHYECLSGARLQVSTKIDLAKAVSDDERYDKWIWTGIKKLNSVRNGYAHSLEPDLEKINTKTQEFLDFINQQNPPNLPSLADNDLARSIVVLCIAVFSVLEVLKSEKSL